MPNHKISDMKMAPFERVEEKVQNALQNISGGNFDNFLNKKSSGTILYHTTFNHYWWVELYNFPPLLFRRAFWTFSSMWGVRPVNNPHVSKV